MKENLYKKMNSFNTALIIVDVVNSCASKKCETGNITFSKIRKMMPALKSFLKKYRNLVNNNVVFINIAPWQKEFLPDNINELYLSNPDTMYYSSDKSGFAEKFFSIKPLSSDLIFTKNTYDAFADGMLNNILKKKKIKYLIMTGIFGDGCVMATINGAFSSGYNLVVLENLIETTDKKLRQKILSNFKKYTWPFMYGHTLTSNKFLSYWKNTKK